VQLLEKKLGGEINQQDTEDDDHPVEENVIFYHHKQHLAMTWIVFFYSSLSAHNDAWSNCLRQGKICAP